MILGIELVLTIYGIVSLVRGHFSIGKGRYLVGVKGRIVGILATCTLPALFLIGIFVGIYLAISHPGEPVTIDSATAVIVEIVSLIVWSALIVGLAHVWYRQQEQKETRYQSERIDGIEESDDNLYQPPVE